MYRVWLRPRLWAGLASTRPASSGAAEPFLSGSSGAYVEQMYEAWTQNPSSVHKARGEGWRGRLWALGWRLIQYTVYMWFSVSINRRAAQFPANTVSKLFPCSSSFSLIGNPYSCVFDNSTHISNYVATLFTYRLVAFVMECCGSDSHHKYIKILFFLM